jgi:hypothetical protein
MTCKKCGYVEKKEVKIFGSNLCKICATFAPDTITDFQNYVSEKIDWKYLETFRNSGNIPGQKQKKGMEKMAALGRVMTRAPMGYDVENGNLILNEDSIKVRSIFKTFLSSEDSLNSLSKGFSLSVPGLKKILSNRTYLGEIKFDGKIHKGNHNTLINSEIFYAVQRKLKTYLRPRNK